VAQGEQRDEPDRLASAARPASRRLREAAPVAPPETSCGDTLTRTALEADDGLVAALDRPGPTMNVCAARPTGAKDALMDASTTTRPYGRPDAGLDRRAAAVAAHANMIDRGRIASPRAGLPR
jgi:hypothetical protein